MACWSSLPVLIFLTKCFVHFSAWVFPNILETPLGFSKKTGKSFVIILPPATGSLFNHSVSFCLASNLGVFFQPITLVSVHDKCTCNFPSITFVYILEDKTCTDYLCIMLKLENLLSLLGQNLLHLFLTEQLYLALSITNR